MAFSSAPEHAFEFWLGDDWSQPFVIYTTPAETVVRDVTGYTTTFMVKRHVSDTDASALITASGTVSGAFNSAPAVNTQIITVTVADTDTDTEIAAGLAHWALKRTDAGAETTLAYGTITLRRAVHVA